MQRDTTGLTTENKELKLRLQAMEQQAHLRDGMHEVTFYALSIASVLDNMHKAVCCVFCFTFLYFVEEICIPLKEVYCLI